MLSAGFCHLLADSLKELAFMGRFPMVSCLHTLPPVPVACSCQTPGIGPGTVSQPEMPEPTCPTHGHEKTLSYCP